MAKAKLLDKINPELWDIPWNVNSQAVGNGSHSLKYLAPYVFRVAISNKRIVKVENDTVFFRYKKPHTNRQRTMALGIFEFIRRFLQHVLPKGFMKIRYYGFLNPTSSISLRGSPLSSNSPQASTFRPTTHPRGKSAIYLLAVTAGDPLSIGHPSSHQSQLTKTPDSSKPLFGWERYLFSLFAMSMNKGTGTTITSSDQTQNKNPSSQKRSAQDHPKSLTTIVATTVDHFPLFYTTRTITNCGPIKP